MSGENMDYLELLWNLFSVFVCSVRVGLNGRLIAVTVLRMNVVCNTSRTHGFGPMQSVFPLILSGSPTALTQGPPYDIHGVGQTYLLGT